MNLTENLFKMENWENQFNRHTRNDENNKRSDFVIIVMVKKFEF